MVLHGSLDFPEYPASVETFVPGVTEVYCGELGDDIDITTVEVLSGVDVASVVVEAGVGDIMGEDVVEDVVDEMVEVVVDDVERFMVVEAEEAVVEVVK